MTAHGLLYDLYQEFSAEDLRSVSDVDAQFYYPGMNHSFKEAIAC